MEASCRVQSEAQCSFWSSIKLFLQRAPGTEQFALKVYKSLSQWRYLNALWVCESGSTEKWKKKEWENGGGGV